ncbi:YraN family protein [Patescibacteria group bacterium]|nr:YraN family protein [Patescibacteria group bacterium]MBU1921663.1 YraN family protein [Patescibacteria group bacterium]
MKNLGKWGEETAASFLMKKGYKLIDKNWRARPGEIDLVMRHGPTLVFVEVKTRSTKDFGYPEEALSEEKMEHLGAAAEEFLQSYGGDPDYRIDCVAIIGRPDGPVEIAHIEGIQD